MEFKTSERKLGPLVVYEIKQSIIDSIKACLPFLRTGTLNLTSKQSTKQVIVGKSNNYIEVCEPVLGYFMELAQYGVRLVAHLAYDLMEGLTKIKVEVYSLPDYYDGPLEVGQILS